jgi:hypothetical protein
MIWNLIGTIGGKVLDIVDEVVEGKDEANKLKFQIQKQLLESKSGELTPEGIRKGVMDLRARVLRRENLMRSAPNQRALI